MGQNDDMALSTDTCRDKGYVRSESNKGFRGMMDKVVVRSVCEQQRGCCFCWEAGRSQDDSGLGNSCEMKSRVLKKAEAGAYEVVGDVRAELSASAGPVKSLAQKQVKAKLTSDANHFVSKRCSCEVTVFRAPAFMPSDGHVDVRFTLGLGQETERGEYIALCDADGNRVSSVPSNKLRAGRGMGFQRVTLAAPQPAGSQLTVHMCKGDATSCLADGACRGPERLRVIGRGKKDTSQSTTITVAGCGQRQIKSFVRVMEEFITAVDTALAKHVRSQSDDKYARGKPLSDEDFDALMRTLGNGNMPFVRPLAEIGETFLAFSAACPVGKVEWDSDDDPNKILPDDLQGSTVAITGRKVSDAVLRLMARVPAGRQQEMKAMFKAVSTSVTADTSPMKSQSTSNFLQLVSKNTVKSRMRASIWGIVLKVTVGVGCGIATVATAGVAAVPCIAGVVAVGVGVAAADGDFRDARSTSEILGRIAFSAGTSLVDIALPGLGTALDITAAVAECFYVQHGKVMMGLFTCNPRLLQSCKAGCGKVKVVGTEIIDGMRYYRHETMMSGKLVHKLGESTNGCNIRGKLNYLCKDFVQIRDWVHAYSDKYDCGDCKALVDNLKYKNLFAATDNTQYQTDKCTADRESDAEPGGCPETRMRVFTMAYKCLMGQTIMKDRGDEKIVDGKPTVYVYTAQDAQVPGRKAIMDHYGRRVGDRMATLEERQHAWDWRASETVAECKKIKCPLIRDDDDVVRMGTGKVDSLSGGMRKFFCLPEAAKNPSCALSEGAARDECPQVKILAEASETGHPLLESTAEPGTSRVMSPFKFKGIEASLLQCDDIMLTKNCRAVTTMPAGVYPSARLAPVIATKEEMAADDYAPVQLVVIDACFECTARMEDGEATEFFSCARPKPECRCTGSEDGTGLRQMSCERAKFFAFRNPKGTVSVGDVAITATAVVASAVAAPGAKATKGAAKAVVGAAKGAGKGAAKGAKGAAKATADATKLGTSITHKVAKGTRDVLAEQDRRRLEAMAVCANSEQEARLSAATPQYASCADCCARNAEDTCDSSFSDDWHLECQCAVLEKVCRPGAQCDCLDFFKALRPGESLPVGSPLQKRCEDAYKRQISKEQTCTLSTSTVGKNRDGT